VSLATDVTARIDSQILVEITNKRDVTATTVNATILALACTDVEARFGIYAQTAYLSTNAAHVSIAVEAVEAILREWGGSARALGKEFWADFKSECEMVKDVGPRSHIAPASNGVRTPTADDPDRTPTFDDADFEDVNLDPP